MNNFSPNMLKTYALCPKKFFYRYVRNISVPQAASLFEKGKKIHALAHYYLQGADISNMEKALNDNEQIIWQSLLKNPYFNKKYLHSEYNLSCKISDYWVGGRIDALMRDGDNYFILDYKTGSIPQNPETDFQTMVYLICADKKLKEYDSLNFVYIDLKNNRNELIELTQERKSEYIRILQDVCKKISASNEYPSKTDRCNCCEYKKLCI